MAGRWRADAAWTLPRFSGKTSLLVVTDEDSNASSRAPVSVLVIDDDDDIRNLVAEILEGEGYSVATASNGVEALTILRQSTPRLILLDLNMPVMNGAEFNQARCENPDLRQIPTVIMSAADRMHERVGHLDLAGAIAKPIELEGLLSVVRRYCSTPPAGP
jgi:CheY-like chemotaxis protein